MRHLARHPFGIEVQQLIRRYSEALDQRDLNVAVIQLWGILEKLTGTVGANYDETIQRAASVFKEPKNAKEKLEYLRMRRNAYVHASRSTNDRDQAAYLVKAFVDPHLVRLVFNEFRVGSLDEYAKFLALPRNVAALERRQALLRRAIKMRK
jgi:hypothetical protein